MVRTLNDPENVSVHLLPISGQKCSCQKCSPSYVHICHIAQAHSILAGFIVVPLLARSCTHVHTKQDHVSSTVKMHNLIKTWSVLSSNQTRQIMATSHQNKWLQALGLHAQRGGFCPLEAGESLSGEMCMSVTG